MAAARDRLVELLDPVVTGMGFEMVDLEVNAGRSGGLLRVFIDSAAGITLDDCEAVSRRIGSVLDVADPMGGRYTLEVSSPGLDRRLVRPEHFDRFRGAEVTIKLRRLVDGRRKVRGTLVGRDEDVIEVFTEGSAFRVPLAEVDVARLVPDFKEPARQG
jgi:ribosome maturation factor RimP